MLGLTCPSLLLESGEEPFLQLSWSLYLLSHSLRWEGVRYLVEI